MSRNDTIHESTATTRLCNQCGHSLKMKLRVRSPDNIQKIRDGYIPDLSSSEHSLVTKLIDEVKEDVTRYKREIDRLKNTYANVKQQQETLETYLSDLRCIVAPIRRLPSEVLGEIFGFVCGMMSGSNLSKVKRSLPAVSLLQVCSKWRKIVNTMPSLWSRFTLSHCPNGSAMVPLKFYLDSSKQHTLDFNVEVGCGHINKTELAALIEHADRWRSVRFTLPHGTLGRSIFLPLNQSEKELPELVSLQVGPDPNSGSGRESDLPVGCLNLRHLSLNGFDLNLLYPRPSIQTIHLTNLSSSRIVHIIESCPSVQHISLRHCIFEPAYSIPALTLEALRSLRIDYDGDTMEVENGLFENFIFPNLTSLELVDSAFTSDPYDISSVFDLLSRSSCPLTHLSVEITLTDDSLSELLAVIPTVTHLKLAERGTESMVTNKLLRNLMPYHTPKGTCTDPPMAVEAAGSSTVGADGDLMADDLSKAGTGTTVGDTPTDGPPAVDSVPSTLLPALIDLTLDVQPVFDDDVLVDFIRSRWRPTEATSAPQLSLSQSSNASGSSSLGISDVETTDPPKPLPIACLSRFSLTRATGLLFDELRTRLEVIGKEGLEVIFSG